MRTVFCDCKVRLLPRLPTAQNLGSGANAKFARGAASWLIALMAVTIWLVAVDATIVSGVEGSFTMNWVHLLFVAARNFSSTRRTDLIWLHGCA
jgi:hypothetical protein